MGQDQLPPEEAMPRGYAEIADHFRRKILDGELRPGTVLPSMREVLEDFKVTLKTVNRAFQVLKSEGLTIGVSGVGTIVADRPLISSTGVARADRLLRTGKEYMPGETSSGHEAGLVSCRDPEYAALLEIDLSDEVVVRRRIFRRNGRPTSVGLSVIHMRAFAVVPEVAQQGQLKPFWHLTYHERCGKQIKAMPERRTARHASSDELAALEVEAPPQAAVPVLVLRTVWYDDDGPIEIWDDVNTPGTWQIAND